MCQGSLSGDGGRNSEREVWLQVSAGVSTPPHEESSGTEAGGGHGHDTQQGGTRAPLLSPGRELHLPPGALDYSIHP